MRIDQTQSGQSYGQAVKNPQGQSDIPFTLEQDTDSAVDSPELSSSSAGSSSANSVGRSLSAALWGMSDAKGSGGASVSTAVPSMSTAVESGSGTGSLADSLADEFAQLVDMSPAERIRAQYLQSHHLKEAQFEALPQSEQDGINQEIAKQIQRQLGAGDGKSSSNSGDDGQGLLDV